MDLALTSDGPPHLWQRLWEVDEAIANSVRGAGRVAPHHRKRIALHTFAFSLGLPVLPVVLILLLVLVLAAVLIPPRGLSPYGRYGT